MKQYRVDLEYEAAIDEEGASGSHTIKANTLVELALKMGRFRRLVKEEDIGWNTPWKTVTGHPRHKELP